MQALHEKNRIIRFSGRLDANSSSDLDQTLMKIATGTGDIILDLSGCSYLSSAGIRILLKITRQLQSKRHELIITGVIPEVLHVLEVASLTRVLHLEGTIEKAQAVIEVRRRRNSGFSQTTLQGHQLIYHPSDEGTLTATYCNTTEVLSYHELGFAIGFGSFSNSPTGIPGCTDLFAMLGSCAAFIPTSNPEEADFRLISDPVTTGLSVCETLSFGLHPTGTLRVSTDGRFPFEVLSHAVREVKQIDLTGQSVILAIVVDQDATHPSVSLVLGNNVALANLVQAIGMKRFGKLLETNLTSTLIGITCRLATLEPVTTGTELRELLKQHLTFENILAIEPVQPDALLQNPIAWLFHASHFVEDKTQRMVIEVTPGADFGSPNPFLARVLYKDSSRLSVDPLHGGYAAKTYHITSFDHEGRKMRPTVMKVANRNLISRESERCKNYAQPYILNNCAVVLGAAHHEKTMAIRYNFVGVGGENSQLKWLAHYYQEREMDFLEPLFDKVFLQILKPWYGQPVSKTIYPFQDHDPTLTFFPHIYQTVSDLFSVSADDKYLSLPEINGPILNPYWFLKHEYPRRRDWGMAYFSGICHGDLNMQNILLDELMNVYLIDFSETRPRSIISDFARLEAIFMIDNAPLENDTDMADYLDFIQHFYSSIRLDKLPDVRYDGQHPEIVNKNTALALKMRKYALTSTSGHLEMIPYYMALLEWITPIVCFSTLPIPQRRLSMMVSSLLSEKVISAL